MKAYEETREEEGDAHENPPGPGLDALPGVFGADPEGHDSHMPSHLRVHLPPEYPIWFDRRIIPLGHGEDKSSTCGFMCSAPAGIRASRAPLCLTRVANRRLGHIIISVKSFVLYYVNLTGFENRRGEENIHGGQAHRARYNP